MDLDNPGLCPVAALLAILFDDEAFEQESFDADRALATSEALLP